MSLATRDHFGKYLPEMGERFKNSVVVNCDLGLATRTLDFKKRFPERFIECGISEANAISIAAGLAQEGFRPLVCSFGHFLTGKFLEIFQSVGLNNAGVILVGTHAGLAIGKDGPTQMGLRDLALMRLLPNMEIIHPIDGLETEQALEYALSMDRPVYLRLCRQPQPELHQGSYRFRFGAWDELKKGRDVLIICQGGTVHPCLEAASELQQRGMSAGVVNVSSLPFSTKEALATLPRYKKVLVVEDHFHKGGLADEMAMLLVKSGLHMPFDQLAVSDYAQSGDPDDLYRRYRLDARGIHDHCLQFGKSSR